MFDALYRRSVLVNFRCFHLSARLGVKDYYAILSVPRNATQEQIKSAYYMKAKLHHPDASGKNIEAFKFQEIAKAYDVLGDIVKRRAYDRTIRPPPKVVADQCPVGYDTSFKSPFRERRLVQPINEKHVNYTHNKLIKQVKEVPEFRLFEDHHYPGTEFNRFEYSRHWDSNSKMYVYMKRPDADRYEKYMETKQAHLRWITTMFFLTVAGCLAQKFMH